MVIPRLSIIWKAATLLAAGLAAGLVAGLIKEYADQVRNQQNSGNPNYVNHVIEFKDVLYTGVGGLIGGGVVAGGIAILSKKPLLLGATLTGMSIFVGRNVIKCCVFNKCAC